MQAADNVESVEHELRHAERHLETVEQNLQEGAYALAFDRYHLVCERMTRVGDMRRRRGLIPGHETQYLAALARQSTCRQLLAAQLPS